MEPENVENEVVNDPVEKPVCTNCTPEVSACAVCNKQEAELA